MKIDQSLLSRIKLNAEAQLNGYVLKELFEKGLIQISISDLRLTGFNAEIILNSLGNQSSESMVDEFPFFAIYHFEGFTLTKDKGSSVYCPTYKIERNSMNKSEVLHGNMKMKCEFLKNRRENTEWAWKNEF